MKSLILAEKPSVAADLSRVLSQSGKLKKVDDYYENDHLVIASAVGHIVELFMPEDIDKKLKYWTLQSLPIIPSKFELKPIQKTLDKFKSLKKLLARKDIDTVINACDAGREGELIFTYLYELAECKKPVKRLWMLSMTPNAIREAFDHLRDGKDMIRLQEAARCRSESDWLIGINGTRAFTTRLYGHRKGQAATAGRVQTPTLTLVIDREKEIAHFHPRAYWQFVAQFKIHSGEYEGIYQKPHFRKNDDEHDRSDRIWSKEEAEKLLKEIESTDAAAIEETFKQSSQQPPLLYDLTSLQREANVRYGFSAARTLQLAQSLYEKHKAITYPRTDAKALPEDYAETCKQVLENIPGDMRIHAQKALQSGWVKASNARIFNNKNISDHFAIIPTHEIPKKLNEGETKIYDLIARRFIAAFYPPAKYQITTRISKVGVHIFKTEGKVLTDAGWLAVHGKVANAKEDLPPITAEDGSPPIGKFLNAKILEDTTRPPAHYTDATLLSAMEYAGKFVEDEELALAMKGKGLGTPATRAQIIDHLIKEKYLERQQRDLIPTTKAEMLINFIKAANVEVLTSPAITGEWEHKLHQIEAGTFNRNEFMREISNLTVKIIERIKSFEETEFVTNMVSPSDQKPLIETMRVYKSQDGIYTIYKIIGNRQMHPEEIEKLLRERQIGPFDDFRSKTGKPFSAILKLDEAYKVKFVFESNGSEDKSETLDFSQFKVIASCPIAAKGECSCKSGNIYETPSAYICENHHKEGEKCKFRVGRTLLGRTIPSDQFVKLVEKGETDLLDHFISKKTRRPFSAHLILKDDGSIGFKFAPKEEKVKTGASLKYKKSKKN